MVVEICVKQLLLNKMFQLVSKPFLKKINLKFKHEIFIIDSCLLLVPNQVKTTKRLSSNCLQITSLIRQLNLYNK